MSDLSEVLGPDGLLAQHIDGFSYRPQQLQMAESVAEAMADSTVLITEAGTGTGKTFAYLVPALLSGLKVIISTGTKNLQDQLYHRDLPLIKDLLAVPASVALLKGRSNYLCVHRLDNALSEGRLRSRELVDQLMEVRSWSANTKSGDIAELSSIPEDSHIWPIVTSTVDNCLGSECPAYGDCHLVEARRRSQEADLVVVNHHLLCADFALKEEGFGELLPEADCFIVDEAHQLPETASNFFGTSVSGRQLLELARDSETEYLREAGDLPEIPVQVSALSKSVRDLRLVFGLELRRGPWSDLEHDESVANALSRMREELDRLESLLGQIKERGKGVESCYERCGMLKSTLSSLFDQEDDNSIRWFETYSQSFSLNRTPLDISVLFQSQMQQRSASWIFTSATLAVGESFHHLQGQLGVTQATT
ncbi:MAG: ATP-dependent DNA helicase, partial [Gammaproteobacteria bacterium]